VTSLSDIEARRIRDAAIRDTVRMLTREDADCKLVGKRTIIAAFILHSGEEDTRQLLCENLGMSKSRACRMISAMSDLLEQVRGATF
jgi:hypothetical protein